MLLYLVFGVLIPSFASYEDIWAAFTSLERGDVFVVALLFVALELLKQMTNALLIPGLGLRRAQLADAAAISSTVPGPSGTAARAANSTASTASPPRISVAPRW